jgi:hypothetical protein
VRLLILFAVRTIPRMLPTCSRVVSVVATRSMNGGLGTDNGEVTISLSDLFEYCTVSHNRTTIRFTCSTASLPTTAGAQACWTITIAVPIVAPTVSAECSTPVISWPECRRGGPRIAGFLSARADLGRRCTEIRRAPLRGTRRLQDPGPAGPENDASRGSMRG